MTNENLIDRRPEWSAFTKEENEGRRRTGLPISYSIQDKNLSTVIDRINRDAHGKKLPTSTRLKMFRLKKLQHRTKVYSSIDRNLSQAMIELDRLTDKLNIPNQIKERAAIIYRKILDLDLVRGRSIMAIVSATLYIACRAAEIPRTLKEVASASGLKKKDIGRCYRLLLKELDFKMPIDDPTKEISKIASKAKISASFERDALKIILEAKKRGIIAGKEPVGLAAAALYITCQSNKKNITQRELATAANVTEVTVRNRYKSLKNALKLSI